MVRKNYREVYRKGRVIQSWKALNLYNLATYSAPNSISKTFYQQKWQAKSHTRTYHGRQVREKQWQLMFNRRIPAVVDMNVARLAKDDGSKQAAGRGSGRDEPPWMARRKPKSTPYMGMTFWPLERRLDTAIFRAMFASSVRTARQFVIHGHVKVNGKKIKYPGYLLNPGDMFSVDPELVMLSTGMQNTEGRRKYVYNNPPVDAPPTFESIKNKSKRAEERRNKSSEEAEPAKTSPEATSEANATPSEVSTETPTAETSTEASATQSTPADPLSANKLKSELQKIESQLNLYLSKPLGKGYTFRTRAAKRIHALRQLRREVRDAIKASSESTDSTDPLKPLQRRLDRKSTQPDAVKDHLVAHNASQKQSSKPPPQSHITLLQNWPNAPRQDKPYLTPWLPRNWMSAFAFIPRYLEVNQNVCSAVYLRHPVARPGLAEVPSPFDAEMGLLAYQWYLRRR